MKNLEEYTLEDTCHALNSIRAIGELFRPGLVGECRDLSSEACHGVYETLIDAVEELRFVIKKEFDIAWDESHELESVKAENAKLKEDLERYRLQTYEGSNVIKLEKVAQAGGVHAR